jgi:predicted nuclease of predicted toxin-antitoxin system
LARLLCDENLGRTVPRLLREAGHDVLAIIEQDRGVSDHEVFELCLQTHRVLVTRDLDFSDIRRFPLGSHDGLIVLRYPADATFEELAAAIVRGLEHAGDQLLGALLVVTPGTLRLRSPDLSDGD